MKLGELGSFSKGKGIKKDEVAAHGFPCIRYGEIYTRYHNNVIALQSRIPHSVAVTSQKLEKGDLLFAGSGETAEEIGKCVAYLGDEEAYAGGDIVILSPSRGNSMYLGYLLNHTTVADQKSKLGQGDAVVHISARNLASIVISLPSQDEQNAIADVISAIDYEIKNLTIQRDKVRFLKQGMMQELLTGKTRLV